MTTPTGLEAAPVVTETVRLVRENYPYPEAAEAAAAAVEARLAAGEYDGLDAQELARRVTETLRSTNGDRHLGLHFHEEPVPEKQGEAVMTVLRRAFDTSLGGVRRLELLDGGVALLEIAPILFPVEWAAEPLGAALTVASRAPALLLDLRGNKGGDPQTVAFVCGYLLEEPTHLNTMHARGEGPARQSWSPAHVPGRRFGGSKPLYVLTSGRTFSGAEELAYDLQQLGRAVVVGETTGGGANARDGWTVHPHLEATIPTVYPRNPVSGTNWEGTGVTPDVAVPAAEAEERALALAIAELAG